MKEQKVSFPQNQKTNNKTQTIRVSISGMSCMSCSNAIEKALKNKDFILKAEVFLLTHTARIEFDSTKANKEDIISIIESVGYKAELQTQTNMFVKNTQTQNAVFTPKNTLNMQNNLFVKTNNTSNNNTESNIKQDCDNIEHTNKSTKLLSNIKTILYYIENIILNTKRRLIISVFLTIIILYISMGPMLLPLPSFLYDLKINAFLQLFLTLCVMHFGRSFYIRGIKAIINLYPNMDSLVALGSLTGFFYSFFVLLNVLFYGNIESLHNIYFESVCVILCFIMIGKFIEENAKNKAMENATLLLKTKVETAHKLQTTKSSNTQEISVDSIKVGDYLRIQANSYIPVDGILISQKANIDESMLSGENLPITKDINQNLYAGTLNLETSFIMQATSTTKNSTLSKMQELIQNSYESKAKIAQLADKISGIFVPIVLCLASLSFIFWFFKSDIQTALIFFANTLLISCPCALGLATPMAILCANARANKMGIFFKNAQSIEQLPTCDYIVFDKTGTLTKRDFILYSINIYNDSFTQQDILQIVASMESTSNHVIAKSICKHANNLVFLHIHESKHIDNLGIKATLEFISKKENFIIGNKKLMESIAINNKDLLQEDDGINIYLAKLDSSANEYTLISKILLKEELKDDSKNLFAKLKENNIVCEILSGDSERNVSLVAKELNVKYHAQCTPQDKLQYIKDLQNMGHKVIMVGDGMNDSIAIAQSNVSIVMSSGSSISIEYGDIIYFSNNLGNLWDCIFLSKATLSNIRQNLFFAFLYNVICIPIAMGALNGFGIMLNPMFASLAMSLSSISVVLNAMRLRSIRLF